MGIYFVSSPHSRVGFGWDSWVSAEGTLGEPSTLDSVLGVQVVQNVQNGFHCKQHSINAPDSLRFNCSNTQSPHHPVCFGP